MNLVVWEEMGSYQWGGQEVTNYSQPCQQISEAQDHAECALEIKSCKWESQFHYQLRIIIHPL